MFYCEYIIRDKHDVGRSCVGVVVSVLCLTKNSMSAKVVITVVSGETRCGGWPGRDDIRRFFLNIAKT